MEVKKRSSKGGFRNLFDWNGKSRRKLFSDNCDQQEEAKKGKGNGEASTLRNLQMDFVEEHATSSRCGGSYIWNSSSMVMNDEVCGPKAPGVVARLMGLDSLPSSGEPKMHKVQNQKINRFQTEILPPKSVKPIALTNNKSPRFVLPMNATQIMESASRIMQAGPEAVHRGRAGSNSSTSVPLRIRELKLRLESESESSSIQQSKKPNLSGRQNLGKKTTRSGLVLEQRREEQNRNSSQDSGKEKQGSSNRHQGSSQSTKIPSSRTSNALRQNTQKQNSSSGRYDSVSKYSSDSSKQDRQMQRRIESISKIVNKVAVRAESGRTNTVRDAASFRNKKHALRNADSLTSDKILSRNDTMSARYDFGTGQSMDVVSFTFSSPLKRYSTEEKFSCSRMTSDTEFSVANGDSSLNVLLEQKLRELKDKMEVYNSDMARTDSLFTSPSSLKDEDSFSTSTCSVQDSFSTVNLRNTSWDHEESSQLGGDVDDEMISLSSDFDCSSVASARQNSQAQLLEVVEEFSCGTSRNEAVFVPATAFPVLREAFEDGSRDDTNGKVDACIHVPESYNFSTSTSFSRTPTNWELEYVKNILNKAELTLDHHVSGQEVVNRSLFDELESQENLITDHEDCSKLQRKVLFDRTNEWLDEKFRDLLIGCPKLWTKWEALVRRNVWVAEEVYREINGQICIEDMMVDVVVDEDMSHLNGKWSDFGVELFDEGTEIGNRILSGLVDDLIKDLGM